MAVGRRIYTIGHSTLTIEQFLVLLRNNGVEVLADVRTIPRSRHNPQYEANALGKSLLESGIDYKHMKALGGLRRPLAYSKNLGWRNLSFRGFADYMQTEDFREGLSKLVGVASERPTAIMCAEAVPWRCHRSLLADALLVRHFEVMHIVGDGPLRPHSLTRFAKVRGEEISYPEAADE